MCVCVSVFESTRVPIKGSDFFLAVLHMSRDSFVCALSLWCDVPLFFRGIFLNVLIRMWYVTWLIHICAMTHLYLPWLTHMGHFPRICAMTFSYVTRLIWRKILASLSGIVNLLICDMTHSYLCHDSFICDVTHAYAWQDSLTCDVTHLYASWLTPAQLRLWLIFSSSLTVYSMWVLQSRVLQSHLLSLRVYPMCDSSFPAVLHSTLCGVLQSMWCVAVYVVCCSLCGVLQSMGWLRSVGSIKF